MKIMKALKISMFISLFLVGTVSAAPFVIDDSSIGANTFWGGMTPSGYNDVVGNLGKFDISKMEITTSNGNLIVKIFSTYFDNVGELSTGLGDLFISTNGWNPLNNDAHNTLDTAANGESWEYAMVGNGLYTVNPANITNSFANPGYLFRQNQEVRYNVGSESLSGTGSYTQDNETITYQIALANLGLSENENFSLGFHWAMTCANDVIEGGYNHQVPEPATMVMLGFGLFGLVAIRRRSIAN